MLTSRKIPLVYVFSKVKTEVILITFYAVFVGILDEGLHIPNISIPVAVPTILGTAISLLLGFRTAQAYDRWWEARKIWGAIVNDSRSITRQLLTFLPAQGEDTGAVDDFRRKFTYRQIAWCYCLGRSLRGLKPLDEKNAHLLSPTEIEKIKRHDNIPNALLELHGNDIRFAAKKGWLNPYQQVAIDEMISRLCDSMGKSERIKNTVFPTFYSFIIHLFLFVFVAFLPFGLVDYFGIVEVPLVISVATIFFLIEKTAIYLQDPFENRPTDVSVTAISRTIEINLRQMLAEKEVPEKTQPEKFYLM